MIALPGLRGLVRYTTYRKNKKTTRWTENHCACKNYQSVLSVDKEVLIYTSVSVAIQMKATEQYFPVVLFIMLYKVVLTFESIDEMLKCDHFK